MLEYGKTRSEFWLKIFDDNPNQINISANGMVMELLQSVFPQLSACSPTGWKPSTHLSNNYNLWIPSNRIDFDLIERVKLWAEQANQHIWLGLNRYTQNFFVGDEVDYCLAADWNFDIENYSVEEQHRTDFGKAEYELKYNYPKGFVNAMNAHLFFSSLSRAVLNCIDCLPIDLGDYIITTIPAVKEKQNKLAWQLAGDIAVKTRRPFISVTLAQDKPQIKEQTVEDKIHIWRKIFSDNTMFHFSNSIRGANVLIIDDLYQSGASIWCFAEYLKNVYNVRSVIAVTSVKALKDGGNK